MFNGFDRNTYNYRATTLKQKCRTAQCLTVLIVTDVLLKIIRMTGAELKDISGYG
jgi:hypothetical protein